MSRVVVSLLVVGLLASVAPAAASFAWVPVALPDASWGGDVDYPAGYTSYDLMMTVTTNIATIQLYAKADVPAAGDFYQDVTFGADFGPNEAFWPVVNDLRWDTVLRLPVTGGLTGSAVDIVPDLIPPTRGFTLDDQLLDAAWGVSGGAASGPGTFTVARVTVRDGTTGTWGIWGTQTGEPIEEVELSGVGPLFVPEPATLLVLLSGALLGIRRRR